MARSANNRSHWVNMGAKLWKCSREQLRPVSDEESMAAEVTARLSKDFAEDAQAGRHARFVDITGDGPPDVDMDDIGANLPPEGPEPEHPPTGTPPEHPPTGSSPEPEPSSAGLATPPSPSLSPSAEPPIADESREAGSRRPVRRLDDVFIDDDEHYHDAPPVSRRRLTSASTEPDTEATGTQAPADSSSSREARPL